jgi:hypothetical protein
MGPYLLISILFSRPEEIDRASRQRVLDVVTRLADTGYLESRRNDFTCSPTRAEGPLGRCGYGALAAREIAATGTEVNVWDLGNEIEFGVVGVAVRPTPGSCRDTAGGDDWYRPPDAVDTAIGKMTFQALMQMPEDRRIAWLAEHIWPHDARMLAAVASGIRAVDPKARFSTHVSGIASTQSKFVVAFFKAMKQGGFSADELGVSYYPTSSAFPKDRLQAFPAGIQG